MLPKHENDLLTHVGPGTPMGEVLRRYWMPAMLSNELPEPDCAPARLRLLSEDLVAWRNTDGSVGIMQNACPHRGASMFFGRNEENGLRCVYHGWKFDTEGACIDMPNEPAESNFKHKIHATAYPTVERGGAVWIYMGPPEKQPASLPDLQWSTVPAGQTWFQIRLQRCNWVQAVEGGIDSSHVSFLHAEFGANRYRRNEQAAMTSQDRRPHFEVVDTDFGTMIGARRERDADNYYWRLTPLLMPFYTMIPPSGGNETWGGHAWVPMDDENTLTWTIQWDPAKPFAGPVGEPFSFGAPRDISGTLPPTTQPGGRYLPVANAGNDYLLDYELQRTRLFCGITNSKVQDQGIQESMGVIYDRTKEHLGSADTAIINARRRWIMAARALQADGATPPGIDAPQAYRVRSISFTAPRTASWVEEGRKLWTLDAAKV